MTEKIALLISAMRDKRTPWYAKVIVVLTLAYIISPIDLIPDFIPVIGLLDEIILIPIAYNVVVKLIPKIVKEDAMLENSNFNEISSIKIIGVFIVTSLWIVFLILTYYFFNLL